MLYYELDFPDVMNTRMQKNTDILPRGVNKLYVYSVQNAFKRNAISTLLAVSKNTTKFKIFFKICGLWPTKIPM